jgi:phosphatidylglycerol:prolipoprotein diacylglycerol transferase
MKSDMIPVLLELGPFKIHSYGLMIAIGFLTSLYFIQRDAKKVGIDPIRFSNMAYIALPLGIAGTRLAHIIMFPESYSWSDPIGWIAVWKGGLVFQGGPPVAMIFVYFYLKKHKISFWKAADVIMPYLALGHAFGRVGCFLNGCCFGKVTDVPWAITYPKHMNEEGLITGSDAFKAHIVDFSDITIASTHSHPIHPAQLYAVFGLMLLCGTLLYLRKHWHPFVGFTFPMYFIIYGVHRAIIEHFRGDSNPVHILNLTDQQVFGLLFSLLGVALFFILRNLSAKDA